MSPAAVFRAPLTMRTGLENFEISKPGIEISSRLYAVMASGWCPVFSNANRLTGKSVRIFGFTWSASSNVLGRRHTVPTSNSTKQDCHELRRTRIEFQSFHICFRPHRVCWLDTLIASSIRDRRLREIFRKLAKAALRQRNRPDFTSFLAVCSTASGSWIAFGTKVPCASALMGRLLPHKARQARSNSSSSSSYRMAAENGNELRH